MHLIYALLSYLVFGALFPLTLFHPKLREGVRRRLGLYETRPFPPSRGAGPRLWLHGASAGDLLALFPIIQELRRLSPEATLIVSTMTNSGYAIARDKIRPHVDGITYVPYDWPGATRRAMRALRPDVLVLEYAELWPNLIHAAKKAGAAVVVTNGRISEALVGRYRMLHALIGNQLEKVDLLLMREEVEAERARALGAPPERVEVTGNTKFDSLSKAPAEEVLGALRAALGLEKERVFVAGSTHEGEERDLLRCFRGLREVDPTLRMIIAPRYVERAGKIVGLARAEGFEALERSEAGRDSSRGRKLDVLVLDTMGELTAAYALASLVFVGGSFVPRGGQNILEPAGEGRPVLFGPYMMNFHDSVEVLLGRGGIQVPTPAQLEKIARELLLRPDELSALGDMARAAVAKVRGASTRNAERILTLDAQRRTLPAKRFPGA